MKIDLTRKELEYLQDRPFWVWKRTELDAKIAEIWVGGKEKLKKSDVRAYRKAEKWYKDLYIKLGGKVK